MRLMASAILIPLSSTIHCASHPILHGSNRYRLSCVIASLIFLLLLIRWTLWRSKTSLCGRDIDPLTCMFSAPGWGSAYWWCLLHRAWTEYIRCHQPRDHTQCHNHGWSHVLFDSSWQRSPSPLWFTWTWALSCSPRLVFFYFKMFSESFRRSLIPRRGAWQPRVTYLDSVGRHCCTSATPLIRWLASVLLAISRFYFLVPKPILYDSALFPY